MSLLLRNRRWLVAVLLLACVAFLAYTRRAASEPAPFEMARDVPRGALVYAQFSDLPALLKRWDESALKRDYLASANFNQFRNRHLALKLAARWQEFNDALGFTLDTGVITGAAEKRGAVAIYDIGRLELVLVAPLGAERAAVTAFFQSKDRFAETALPDGTTYYSRDVAADRGRQVQKILFATARGRFVLATSEQLLLRTLANINAKSRNDSLFDEPAFRDLARAAKPHTATVWVNQAKLNDDWYFRRYWLMSDTASLKNLRAGMFDWEMQDAKWYERREFLLNSNEPARAPVTVQTAQRLARLLPGGMPYVRLQTVDGATSAALVRDALCDRLPPVKVAAPSRRDYYAGSLNESVDGYYSYLGDEYDEDITAPDDEDEQAAQDAAFRVQAEQDALNNLSRALQAAQPFAAATAETVQVLDAPLFAESQRVTVLSLREPANFSAAAFEEALAGLARNRLMLTGATAKLQWADHEGGRVLEMPKLGWALSYQRHGAELVVANQPALLQAEGEPDLTQAGGDDYTVIRLAQRGEVLDKLARRLEPTAWQKDGYPTADDILTTVSDLLETARHAQQITRRRTYTTGRLREEIEITMRTEGYRGVSNGVP